MRAAIIAVVAAAAFAMPGIAEAAEQWHGEYYANTDLSGMPTLVRQDDALNFDWAFGSADATLPSDGFGVRWTRTITVAAGTYRFTTTTDDGVRLFVDGDLMIDHWSVQPGTQWYVDVPLSAGDHTVKMEYFENEGYAFAKLTYRPFQQGGGATDWNAEYFENRDLTGEPAMNRADAQLDFDWGWGAPADGFLTDDFSVRWTRTLELEAGTYTFQTYTDDGVRLRIDGNLVIDRWALQSATVHRAEVTLAAGSHTIVMEYFEGTGAAVARLSWARPSSDGVIRIDSGGSGYVDRAGALWSPDSYSNGGVAAKEAQPIWNTDDDPLYTTERAQDFAYHIPVANGDYVVRLHFAELFRDSPGVRQFNVTIEGTSVLSGFDIHAQAGKATLLTRSFRTTVSDASVDLAFENVFDNAVVHAIDVHPAATEKDLDAPAFAAIPEPENATHTTPPTVTLSVTDRRLRDGYWRLDDSAPEPLFAGLGATTFSGQFTLPVETFNSLAVGSHTLRFGANDEDGNAATTVWRFRKLNSAGGSTPIAFGRRVLVNPSTPGAGLLAHPTTLQFGPDGRLYVGQQDGYVFALTLDSGRNVTAVERIDAIHDTPNTNPDGSPAPGVVGRHLMGIDFDPSSTPDNPILWAVHSDPRMCFSKTPSTCSVNTDSGILTRLQGPSFDAVTNRTDFVTGLPRSRELHAPNAVHFGPDGWLYMTIGSNTNYGAPSTAFSQLAEVYLTAAVLRFNVNGAAGRFPLDVRDVTGPAGVSPGVFEVYATGYRNPFDFLWHSNGKLYVNVNAGNVTNGTTPGPADGCPDGFAFDPGTRDDFLSLVEPGDYGGHPNPAQGHCVLDDGAMYPTPLPAEQGYHPPILHYSNGTSSDGMAEYPSPTFGGQMLGNIISATYAGNQSVRRVALTPDGRTVEFEEDLAILTQPLDVAVGSDGSIYVAEYGADDIQIMEPTPPLTGSWEVETPLPVPTQEVGVAACGGRVYVVGGLTGPTTDTNAVWVYNPDTKVWSSAAPYPGTAVDHPGVACVDGTVYVLGGLLVFGNAVANVYAYDPGTNTWTPRAAMPRARGAMGVAVLDGKIYAAGGASAGSAIADLAAYDPATNSWQTLASMPTARDHLILEASGGRLYAVGGRSYGIDQVVAANETYDPRTGAWSARAPMPTPRAGMASGTLNGHIQVWGGEGPSGAPTSTYRQGEDYDPRTNTWITIADELTPRHGTDGATLGDKIYVPGGGPASGSSVTDVHEVFSFVSSAPPTSCIPRGSDPATTDSDGDRYTNKDEADNETDPCSPASTPPDFDNDFVSDRNDPDDDADGVPDSGDQFQLDPANGSNTALPWVQNWNPGDVPAGKFANSGFPGVQLTTNGSGFIADRVHAGGAGGYMTVSATGGTNRGVANDQDNALQVGFDARDATRIATRIADPLSGGIVEPGKAGGVFVGLDEDNFVELALATDNGSGSTGLVFGVEVGGAYVANPGITPVNLPLPGMTSTLDLVLSLHPGTKRITAQYRVNSDNGADLVTIGSVDAVAFPALAAFFELGAATGVFTTNSTVSSFGLAYDYFRVEPAPTATVTVNTAVVPASDPGRFNLQIDGVTKAADVGDGGTTGAQIVFPGTHTVGETAGTGTSLSEYAVTIGGDCAANGTVALAAGESKQCTITNTRRAAAVHVADLFTTDAAGAPRATFARGDAVFWRIKIVDEAGAPVAGASVTSAVVRPKGTVWTTPFATTGADGWAAFSQKTQKGNPTGTYTIRITDVNAPGRAYDPTANVRSETTFVLQ